MKKLITKMLLLMFCVSALLSFDAAVVFAKPNKNKGNAVRITDTVKTFAEVEDVVVELEEDVVLEDEVVPVEEIEEGEEVEEELEEELEEGEKPVKLEKVNKLKKSPSAIANQLIKEMGVKRNMNGVNLIALLNESLATDPLLQTAVPADLEAYNTMVVEFIRTQHELRMTLEPVITLE
ncbi:MAG TPA: hypothetical protein VLN47_07695 [Clostridiaceae bacterium]|nr:hypothetical protein [Clostridiaceae bacterium]